MCSFSTVAIPAGIAGHQILREMHHLVMVLSISVAGLLWFCTRFSIAANIPTQEFNALYDLYNATDGANWLWFVGMNRTGIPWSFTAGANPCVDDWQGIKCELDSLEDVYHITAISLTAQNLAGQLPDSLSQLSQLSILNLCINELTGTIPQSFSNLTNIVDIWIQYNHLSGTIPAFLGALPKLQSVELDYNNLIGTLPTQWLSGPSLQLFTVIHNLLTGTMPIVTTINTLSMIQISISSNDISGTLPDGLYELINLEQLHADYTYVSGTVSNKISALTKLKTLSIGYSTLTGSLPTLEGMKDLDFLSFDFNYLTGTISPHVGVDCISLGTFELSGNFITGSIPANLGDAITLQSIVIADNYLTGTIPASLGQLELLTDLYTMSNLLTGTLPTFSSAPLLNDLELYHNMLSGSLDGIFDTATQPYLQIVILTDNQFTGTLPSALFLAQSLQVVVLDTNCFHGSISEEICQARHLSTLVLDGLSASAACSRSSRLSHSFGASAAITGSIPSCLFELPNITTLHLAGNGLTGTIPSDVTVSSSLYDLTLSHNRLTGTIPTQIQQRVFYQLDLSYNRLSGTLVSDFRTVNLANFTYATAELLADRDKFIALWEYAFNMSAPLHFNLSMVDDVTLVPSVLLVNNRLSGRIPAAFQTLPDVSILGTNLFSCRLDGSDLPPADNGDGNYQCGSSAFDVPYYVWLSLSTFAVAYGAWLWWSRNNVQFTSIKSRLDMTALRQLSAVAQLLGLLDAACRVSLRLAVAAIVVLLPTYCALSAYYGEYTYEYAYSVSAAFLSGTTPAAVEFVLWTLLLLLLCVGAIRAQQCGGLQSSVTASATMDQNQVLWRQRGRAIAVYSLFVATNFIVVVGVNIAYVYIAVYQSSALLIFAQVMLSFFKLSWGTICTSKAIRTVAYRYSGLHDNQSSSESAAEFVSVQVLIGLVNNILIPCLVVAAVSPSCFYNAFVRAPTVISEYVFTVCELEGFEDTCILNGPTKGSTEYQPDFVYDYQCSSSMITYYAPAFVNMCIISTFLNPLAQVLCLALYRRAAPGGRWQAVLGYLLPRLLHPHSEGEDLLRRSVYNANRLVTVLCTYVGILMTFGVVFPPLAAALAATVVSVVYFAKLKFGWYASSSEQQAEALLRVLDADCAAIGSPALLVHNVTWMVIVVSSWFYTLFLFDTLGDAVGFEGAYWVLIVMPLIPVVLYAGFTAYKCTTAVEGARAEKPPQFAKSGSIFVASGTADKLDAGRAQVVVSPFATEAEDGRIPL